MENQQLNTVENKKCRVCEKDRYIGNFKTYKSRDKTLRRNICISCEKEWYKKHNANHPNREERLARQRESSRQWRLNNPKEAKARAKHFHAKYRARDREIIYKHYGSKCSCCGESNAGFLTVDHIESDGHVERKKGLYTNGSQFYRFIIQNDFPDNLQLLCYNCNLGRARNGGTCPHQTSPTTISKESTPKQVEADRNLINQVDDIV